MASRRRNIKTHPKPNGDDAPPDNYMPPDRPDRDTGLDQGRTEVVDLFGKDATVTVDTSTGGEGVDLNSAGEGDGRSMIREEGGDGGTGGDDGTRALAQSPGRGDRRASRARGGSGGADGDEDQDYGARVRKRIARERGLVNRERALREQTQRELAAERTARQQQDERIARLERAQASVAGNAGVKDLESKIADLRPQIVAAMEGGETAKVLELQEKLSDLRAQLAVLKYDLEQKQRQADAQAANRQQQHTGTDTDRTAVIDDPQVAELAQTFQRMNRHWWNRSANKEAREDAITIDKEILADITAGDLDFEPYSDEHFRELAARLHETYPDLEIQDLEGQPYQFDGDDMNDADGGRGNGGGNGNGNRQQRGPARGGAPVNRMGQNGRRGPSEVELARQGKVTLTQEDFATMRTFKMDPNNPNDKKYFAKEKARSILSGARSAGGDR